MSLVGRDRPGGVIPCAPCSGAEAPRIRTQPAPSPPTADPRGHAASPTAQLTLPRGGRDGRHAPILSDVSTTTIGFGRDALRAPGLDEPGSTVVLPAQDGAPRVPVGVDDMAGSLSPPVGLR
jgi:hypothetical protein